MQRVLRAYISENAFDISFSVCSHVLFLPASLMAALSPAMHIANEYV
jgi:hypothetical protein